ncbi:hypothetical protein [Fodinicola acaciae]|uniref:hypothetical protein n=1 Tax=Fodinicola acaciae TaxID=2681555 RepID=UPI0013D778A1|nr:hypothetical protein [Fodinicola acaciae]
MPDKISGLTEAMEQFNPQPPTMDTSGVQLPSGGMEEFQQMIQQVKQAFTKLGDYVSDAQKGFQAYKDISQGAARLYLAHNDRAAIALANTSKVDSPVLRGPTQHVVPFGGS